MLSGAMDWRHHMIAAQVAAVHGFPQAFVGVGRAVGRFLVFCPRIFSRHFNHGNRHNQTIFLIGYGHRVFAVPNAAVLHIKQSICNIGIACDMVGKAGDDAGGPTVDHGDGIGIVMILQQDINRIPAVALGRVCLPQDVKFVFPIRKVEGLGVRRDPKAPPPSPQIGQYRLRRWSG